MEKQKKVLDASVILKWFRHETQSEKALELLDEYNLGKIDIIVPELAFLEVINGLRYKKESEEILISINHKLWDLELEIERVNMLLLQKAAQLAVKHNLTIYDSLYVAIANFHGAPLITADELLYKLPNVIPLEKS